MSLADTIARLPTFYDAYRGAQKRNEDADVATIGQATSLAQLLGAVQQQKQRQDAAQEETRIREMVSGARTPQEAIDKLIASGSTKAFEVAGKLKGLLPPPKQFRSIGAGGAIDEQGNLIAPMARPEAGKKRKFESAFPVGENLVQPHYSDDEGMTWRPVEGSKPSDKFPKQGGVSVSLGGINLGKEASNKIDTGLLDTTAGMMRLSTIEGQFRPEFQQTLPRVNAEWSAWKDRLGVGVSPLDKQFLAQFSGYKRNAINSMNEYIKSITGAAMSEAEAQRILRGMPNPGQGMFDGDSPTEFKAKLDDAVKQTKLALARYEYIKRRGISLSDAQGNSVVPLEKMPQIMNERGKELEDGFRKANPRITSEQLSQQVRVILAKEFGLIR